MMKIMVTELKKQTVNKYWTRQKIDYSSLSYWFYFLQSQLLAVNCSLKILNGKIPGINSS